MSLRHVPHQAHPQDHPPHLNGFSVIPNTPNGSAHPSAMVSPATVPSSSTTIISDLDHALNAHEKQNPPSLLELTQIADIALLEENYSKAVEYFQQVLRLQQDNGEVWSAIGHCYLMQDDLQKAHSAYQQALYLLPNPKEDPKLWYDIGVLYDRYGSLDNAEEAFSSVLCMDKVDSDTANEILFRLGIIYKQQGKYEGSLECFKRILCDPPSPLAHTDIWFQIGQVYEEQKNYVRARDAYERVVADSPTHAKVFQQLGWLYHQDGSSLQNQELAIQHLRKSLETDPTDAQSWYLLGRAYMAGQKYNKAYEAYQQAVDRDGRNPTFWCSIGVLYFQINQFRDAQDAYKRAIRINPDIPEVWFDLGSLYESCNNPISDAIDAYARASELDPSNTTISQRLELLRNAQATGSQLPAAPGHQDVHTKYSNAVVPPHDISGSPFMRQMALRYPVFGMDSRGPPAEITLPPPSEVVLRPSPGPFRGGPSPPVVLDETPYDPSPTFLAPMDVDPPPTHGQVHLGQELFEKDDLDDPEEDATHCSENLTAGEVDSGALSVLPHQHDFRRHSFPVLEFNLFQALLWRISSVILVMEPLLVIVIPFLVNLWDSAEDGIFYDAIIAMITFGILSALFTTVGFITYLVARFCLLVLAFLTLRNLPSDVYETVSWTPYIPHL